MKQKIMNIYFKSRILTTSLLSGLLLAACLPRVTAQTGDAKDIAVGVIYRLPEIVVKAGVPFNEKGVTLDGVLEEQEWFAASAFTGFVDNLERQYSPRQTIVYACYDRTNLYLGFDSKLSAQPDADRILVALDPGTGLSRFWISPSGQVQRVGGDSVQAVEAKSSQKDGRWVCEVRVTAKAKPTNGATWKANLVRTYGNPRGHTSWVGKADLTADFAPTELGQLLLRDEMSYVKITSMGALEQGQLRVVGTIYDKAGAGGPERKSLWLDMPLTHKGKVNTLGTPFHYMSGSLQPVLITPAEGIDTLRNNPGAARAADSAHFTLRQDGWKGPALFETDYVPTGRKFPPVEFFTLKVLPKDLLVVWLETLGIKPDQLNALSLRSAMYSPSGKLLQSRTIPKVRKGEVEVEFDAKRLEPGVNQFRATLLDATGKEVATTQHDIEKPDEKQWLNNTIGISDKVPTPFEPVRRKGNAVSVWGREYSFGSGLFAGITSRGQQLLAAPIQLEAVSGGKAITLKPGAWQWREVKDTQAIAVNDWTSAALNVQLKATLEYDGMVRWDVTLRPKATASIEKLTLYVPLQSQRAPYLSWTRSTSGMDKSAHYSGAIPKAGWKGDFRPFVWLGDNDRGLLWFAESMRNWSVDKKNEVLAVTPHGDRVDFRVTMIDRPTTITQPRTMTFGMQASPVRPLPERWREWHRKVRPTGGVERGRDGYLPEIFKHEAEKISRISKERNMEMTVYTYPRFLDTAVPAYLFHANQWRAEGPLAREKQAFVVDQMSPSTSFTDFHIWSVAEAMKKRPPEVKGLLYDLGWVGPSFHPAVSYKDEKGVMQPTWEIFGLRNYYKRVYTLLREQIGQTRIAVNVAGSQIELPLFSFVDATWNGEQLFYDPDDYTGHVPLEAWRAGFTRRQLGNVPLFISGLRHMIPGEGEDKANYSMLTMVHLHDLLIFFSHHKSSITEPFEKAREEFGIAENDVAYIPYWEESGRLFKTSNKSLLFSSYLRPGKALVVAGNISDVEANEEILVDFKALKMATSASVRLFDGLTTRPVTVNNGRINIRVKGKHPVFLLIDDRPVPAP